MQRKPSSGLEAVGWICVAFGLLGLASIPFSALILINPDNELLNPIPAINAHLLPRTILGVIGTLLLAAVGWGALKLKPWTYKAIWGFVVVSVINLTFTMVVMVPAMLDVFGGDSGVRMAGPITMGVLIGVATGFAWPVFLIVFFRMPGIHSQFESPAQPPPLDGH